MENEKSIENRIKDFRKKQKLSQEELAEALGVSRQSVIALEQGRSMPSLPLAVSMCRFFESTFEEIFDIGQEIEREIDKAFGEKLSNDDNIINTPLRPETVKGLRGARENNMENKMEPWRPLREVVSLRDAMDHLFEDSVITPRGGAVMPKIDIKDKKDSILIEAELPGMTEDEINIEVSDGVMTISGEKKEDAAFAESEASVSAGPSPDGGAPASEGMRGGEGYFYKESHSGAFSRSFTLPADVKEEKAEAEMRNGVLMVTIPKIEPKKATKVKIVPKKK